MEAEGVTDRTDAVERAVDSEWRPTREIVARAGFEPTPVNVNSASRRLRALARQGYVERSEEVVPGAMGAHRRALWRLRP